MVMWCLEKTVSSFIYNEDGGIVLLWVISFTGNWYCNYESIGLLLKINKSRNMVKKSILYCLI